MKANAPEKIIHNGIEYYRMDIIEDITIDGEAFVKKDNFIEKACAFLKDRIEHDSIDYPMARMSLIEDFKNYMKEE